LRVNRSRWHVVTNAHPPTSVLLAFPFSRLDFAHAFFAWNVVSLGALAASLWIVQGQLRIPFSVRSFAPLVALLLLCFPLWEQSRLGQLTLVLLLLITGAWAADRSGRPWLAGVLLGAAASIKLFPGFLMLYFALRGRWKVVLVSVGTVAFLTILTGCVLGIDCYRSYLFTVIPEIQWFRVGWDNVSLWGFWSRLFDPAPGVLRDRSLTEPLYYSPALAKASALVSSAVVFSVLAWVVLRDASGRTGLGNLGRAGAFASAGHRTRPAGRGEGSNGSRSATQGSGPYKMTGRSFRCGERRHASVAQRGDLSFALAVTAMLLLSPICWAHYLLLMLVPLAIAWLQLPASRFLRAWFALVAGAFWLGYPLVWTALDLIGRTATPFASLGVLSYQFYALLGFFALALMELVDPRGQT
jgi:hypothetical protein